MYPTLEKYHGTRTRHTCSACNSRNCFVRYVDENGEYISDDCGRCNRESKCGYHKKPREYFAENLTASKFQSAATKQRKYVGANRARQASTFEENKTRNPHFDFIASENLKRTLGGYERNAFVQFLLNLFPDCGDEIQAVLKMYFVGTYENYTCFPSIDRLTRVCRAKLIRFNRENGKRLKGDYDTSSLVKKLKLKEDFNYTQIFFGEHLVPKYPNKTVAVVESEKTAIVASLCFPEMLWLGSNSKTWLKVERLKRLGNRQIILFPDADGFELWKQIAIDARRQGLDVKTSSLIENHATDEQRANGYDIADYLIEQQNEINQTNTSIDVFNTKLATVLNDESLFNDFNLILDEQKAIAIYNGLSESEAERICTRSENVRAVALGV